MSVWYRFTRSNWLNCLWSAEQVARVVARGRITQAEADEILALPRPCS